MREPVAAALLAVVVLVPAARILGVIGPSDESTAARVSVVEQVRGGSNLDPRNVPTTTATLPPSSPATVPPAAAPPVVSPVEPTVPPASTPPPTAARVAPASFVASVHASGVDVYTDPASPRPSLHLSPTTEFGSPRVLLVVRAAGDWLQVLLPIRPNNALGWVRARAVDLTPAHDEVVVDLTTRELVWTRDLTVMLRAPVAVGAPGSPTPSGTYFVTDVLAGGGSYGSYILALNGHSDAYTEFGGGDARIALHGTNDPGSIGRAASHGCVRLTNDLITELAANLTLGTPVTIR